MELNPKTVITVVSLAQKVATISQQQPLNKATIDLLNAYYEAKGVGKFWDSDKAAIMPGFWIVRGGRHWFFTPCIWVEHVSGYDVKLPANSPNPAVLAQNFEPPTD